MLLDHFLDVLSARDVDHLQAVTVCAAHALGFERVGAFLALEQPAPSQPRFFTTACNRPAAFDALSLDISRARADPVMQALKVRHRPLVWNQSFYCLHGCEDAWKQNAEFGYKAGIGSALHLPGGRHHAFGVVTAEALPLEGSDALHALMATVHLLSCYVYEAASRLLLLPSDSQPRLSARERQCLQWTLSGKTAWEVGQILHLSERTVSTALSHAAQKLGCSGKHQAAIRALHLGLVDF